MEHSTWRHCSYREAVDEKQAVDREIRVQVNPRPKILRSAPSRQINVTFKKAPRAKKEIAEKGSLPFD